MSAWHRSPVITICGLCGGQIAVGDPVLVFTLPGIKARRGQKVRCAHCAGPAPPDLPEFVVERAPTQPFTMARFGPNMLPLDYKQRQVAREPGEDG